MTFSPEKQTESSENLTLTLEALTAHTSEDKISVDKILQRFKYRGFGSLLLVPSLITILPTGAIPFVPALCGIIIAFLCIQILMGRSYPWLPGKVKEFEISRAHIDKAVTVAKPYTLQIDRYLQQRLTFLLHDISKYTTAAVSLVLSLIMIVIGFIPMLPATAALPIFFFGLGFIARDGVIISLGYLTIIGSYIGISILANLF